MRVTSKEAKKILTTLEDKKAKIFTDEYQTSTYKAAVGEDPKELRPDYDFVKTQKEIEEIDAEIMRIKHLINLFNANTQFDNGLTIDQVLIKLPQLAIRKNRLDMMRKRSWKERVGITGNVIDYQYTAYNPEEVSKAYDEVCNEINKLQLALDKVNSTVTFEI